MGASSLTSSLLTVAASSRRNMKRHRKETR